MYTAGGLLDRIGYLSKEFLISKKSNIKPTIFEYSKLHNLPLSLKLPSSLRGAEQNLFY